MFQMDFGEAFKNITQQYGINGVFTNSASNYTQQTYSNDTIARNSRVIGGARGMKMVDMRVLRIILLHIACDIS